MCFFRSINLVLVSALIIFSARRGESSEIVEADVIVAGGSTAALAAACAAADQGAVTVLLEPTDWVGGQFTSSGVPAVDEAWHTIRDQDGGEYDVAKVARDPRNMTPWLRDALESIGNPGRGWVSRFCFQPRRILDDHFVPRVKTLAGQLTIYRQTVVKRMEVRDGRIVRLFAIRRIPREHVPDGGYDQLPSVDLPDWYAETPSDRFDKGLVEFTAGAGRGAVFIDGTEWGELLALSGGRYLQGVDSLDGALECDDTCGQATVFGFVQELCAQPTVDSASVGRAERLGLGKFADEPKAWERIWTYRRLLGSGGEPAAGDLSLQNWGYSIKHDHGGNDYPFGYLLVPKHIADSQRDDWTGGVDLKVMAAAEQRAFAWHHWLKKRTPEPFHPTQLRLRPDVLGTGHGLSKLPYVRDTRRSVGIDGFVLKLEDLVGAPTARTGTRFDDRVAIGCYPADVHHLAERTYPAHTIEHVNTRPFYIPYRAMTHESFDNLLAAGKTMAQSFMTNSATRLHPIEWSSGIAAGTMAAWAAEHKISTRKLLPHIPTLQAIIAQQTPVDWILEPEKLDKAVPELKKP